MAGVRITQLAPYALPGRRYPPRAPALVITIADFKVQVDLDNVFEPSVTQAEAFTLFLTQEETRRVSLKPTL